MAFRRRKTERDARDRLVYGPLTHGVTTTDPAGRLQIQPFTGDTNDVLTGDGTFQPLSVSVKETGYWSPWVMDGEGNGDSELVLTDDNAPIMIWFPTP